MEANPYVEEILAALYLPDLKDRAAEAMDKYRTGALAVARHPVSLEVKIRRVLRLQDALRVEVAVLLKEQLSR